MSCRETAENKQILGKSQRNKITLKLHIFMYFNGQMVSKWCQNKKTMVSKTEPLYNTKMSLFDTKRCDKVIAIKRVDGSKPSALFYYREKEESI